MTLLLLCMDFECAHVSRTHLNRYSEGVVAALYTVSSMLFTIGAALEVWVNDGFVNFRPHKLAFSTETTTKFQMEPRSSCPFHFKGKC